MKATILDLRYRMKAVVRALNRREKVEIYYHGQKKGVIIPVMEKNDKKVFVKDHSLFGSLSESKESVEETMDRLRGGRYRDI